MDVREGRLWQEQSDRKMKCSARTAEVRENKMPLFSSFILGLLENKLLLEEPFLDCYATERTWFRHRTPCEEPGGVGVCAGAGAVSSFDLGALLLPSTERALGTTLIWFELVRSVNSCTFSQKSTGLVWNGRIEHFLLPLFCKALPANLKKKKKRVFYFS